LLNDDLVEADKILRDKADKPHECYVAKIQVKELTALGFTLNQEGEPAHFVIPELARDKYKKPKNEQERKSLKERMDKLARILSDNIVVGPSPPPS